MAQSGTYLLYLHLSDNVTISIPTLGDLVLLAGFYLYIASLAPDELLAERLGTHLNPSEDPLEDIEYLQEVAQLEEIWVSASSENRETAWIEATLSIPGVTSFLDGFGPPPEGYETRLFYFDLRPDLEDFQLGIHQYHADEIVIRAFQQPDSQSPIQDS